MSVQENEVQTTVMNYEKYVSELEAKCKEYDEVVEMLKGFTLYKNKTGQRAFVNWYSIGEWGTVTLKAIGTHSSLHAALTALTKGEG